jgi:hypothetical protein
MKKSISFFALSLLLFPLFAQTGNPFTNQHSIRLEEALSNSLMLRLGYQQTFEWGQHMIVTEAMLGLPSGRQVFDDLDMQILAGLPLRSGMGWNLIPSLGLSAARWQSAIIQAHAIEGQVRLKAGYYQSQWHAGLQVGMRKAVSTHVVHADPYKEEYYPGIQDGWYRGLGGALGLEAEGSYQWRSFSVGARLGVIRDLKGQSPLFPFVGGLQLGYHW